MLRYKNEKMEGKMNSNGSILLVALLFSLFLPNLAFSSIVYDNTSTYTNDWLASNVEIGDQITLGGTDRLVTTFLFGYDIYEGYEGETLGNENARVRFYANDGLGGVPGTMLYDSGVFNINYQLSDYSLTGLSVLVPDTFTWTVLFGGLDYWGNGRLLAYDPPTIGTSEDFAWWVTPGGWDKLDFSSSIQNYYARVTASPVPEPTTMLLLGSGLVGLWGAARKKFKK